LVLVVVFFFFFFVLPCAFFLLRFVSCPPSLVGIVAIFGGHVTTDAFRYYANPSAGTLPPARRRSRQRAAPPATLRPRCCATRATGSRWTCGASASSRTSCSAGSRRFTRKTRRSSLSRSCRRMCVREFFFFLKNLLNSSPQPFPQFFFFFFFFFFFLAPAVRLPVALLG
jgi:hypothetical protein